MSHATLQSQPLHAATLWTLVQQVVCAWEGRGLITEGRVRTRLGHHQLARLDAAQVCDGKI